MATYYWVGGSGTWNNVNTTNWSASSGGAGGSGPPIIGDTAIFDSNSGTAATVTLAATGTCTICTINKADINLSLSGNATFDGTLTLTTGTITLNNNTFTVAAFSSSNTNTRVIAFGTGNITVTANSTTVWAMSTMTGFSYSGTPAVNFTASVSAGSRTIQPGTTGATESNALSFNITAGSDTISLSSAGFVRSLSFAGFSGALSNNGVTVYGDLTYSATMTTATTPTPTFAATSGTQRFTTNGWSLPFPVIVNCPGATVQLQDTCTIANTSSTAFTFTAGTISLNGNNLSVAGRFSATAGNARSILFGSNQVRLTGNNTTILNFSNFTNFTYTGTPVFNLTYSGGTGTRTIIVGNTGVTESNALSLLVSAGTDTVTGGSACTFRNVDFTGFAGTLGIFVRDIYGNLTLSSGMTLTAGTNTTSFLGTSGPYTITSNGKTMDFPITFNGVGGTWQPADTLTIGSTRVFTLTNGTFNAGSQNVTIGTFALGAGTKTLTLGSGTWTVAGASWDANTNVANLTVSASTGTISMTSGSAKTFSGGGRTWPTLNQGGAGALTIAQSNTFANITNTVQPATIRLTAGTTQTVSAFSVSGTSGNLITLDTTVAGTQATLSDPSGLVSVSFCSIKDINATGGAFWQAYTVNGNVDGGNNLGWDFNATAWSYMYNVRKSKRILPGV